MSALPAIQAALAALHQAALDLQAALLAGDHRRVAQVAARQQQLYDRLQGLEELRHQEAAALDEAIRQELAAQVAAIARVQAQNRELAARALRRVQRALAHLAAGGPGYGPGPGEPARPGGAEGRLSARLVDRRA